MGWKKYDAMEAVRYDTTGHSLTPICFFNLPAFVDHENDNWLAELPALEMALPLGYYLFLNPAANPHAEDVELTAHLIALLNSLHFGAARNNGFDWVRANSPQLPCLDPRVHRAFRTPVIYLPENETDWREEGRQVPDWLTGWAGDYFLYLPPELLGAAISLRNKYYTEFSGLMDEGLKRTYHWLRLYQLYAENQSKER